MRRRTIILLVFVAIVGIYVVSSFSNIDYDIPLAILNFSAWHNSPVFQAANDTTLHFVKSSSQPIEELTVHLMTKAAFSPTGSLLFYDCNISNNVITCGVPNINEPVLSLPVSYGQAQYLWTDYTPKNGLYPLYIDHPYALYFAGGNQLYDSFLGAEIFTLSRTGAPKVEVIYDLEAVGEITDPLDESQLIDGQPSTNLDRSSVELGCHGGCKNDDVLVYSKSQGDGEIYFDINIGCNGYGEECKNILMRFNYSFPKPEGNEIEEIRATLVRGPDLHIPPNLLSSFKDRTAINIGTLQSGVKSTYRIRIVYSPRNLDKNDPYCIVFDDLGGAGDIFGDAKGEPAEVCFCFEE
jgi:hypothetical protein